MNRAFSSIDPMEPDHFAEWVDDMGNQFGWTKRECARQLGCGINQIARWSQTGAPRYILIACLSLQTLREFRLPLEYEDT